MTGRNHKSNHEGEHSIEDAVFPMRNLAVVAGVTMAGTLFIVARGPEIAKVAETILDGGNTADIRDLLRLIKELVG